MNVFDPKQRKHLPVHQKHTKKFTITSGVALIVLVVGLLLTVNHDFTKKSPNDRPPIGASNNSLNIKKSTGKFKQFTGEQFRDLYNSFSYPNTAPISGNTTITGNDEADAHIRAVAIERGYKQRSAPVSDAFMEVSPGMRLQRPAAQPWKDMQEAAKKDGINIGLTAAYRSADDQRQILLSRLQQTGLSTEAIATGDYNGQISQLLRMTAIPGYSRHHTGYTVDISCEDMPSSSFEYTTCFEWLSTDNYVHAKKYGWIPSYPAGAGNQGPDPESWEYVWVGTSSLTE